MNEAPVNSLFLSTRPKTYCSLWAIVCVFISLPLLAYAEQLSGIQPLHPLHNTNIHSLITDNAIRPLFTAEEQETFLSALEKQPPDWDQLHDPPGEEHGARLFDLNRKRDDIREGHPLLTQRIAFLWSGFLREFHDKHNGYQVVIGPEFTQTSWGIVRFKPTGLPNEMIAVTTPSLRSSINHFITKGKPFEIGIVFTGTLIPWESIIYGFSHDGLEQGMILPVVQVDGVHYFFGESGTIASNTEE